MLPPPLNRGVYLEQIPDAKGVYWLKIVGNRGQLLHRRAIPRGMSFEHAFDLWEAWLDVHEPPAGPRLVADVSAASSPPAPCHIPARVAPSRPALPTKASTVVHSKPELTIATKPARRSVSVDSINPLALSRAHAVILMGVRRVKGGPLPKAYVRREHPI